MKVGGEDCLKYLKKRVEQKRGERKQRFKKRGIAGSRDGCLKGGARTSLLTTNNDNYSHLDIEE